MDFYWIGYWMMRNLAYVLNLYSYVFIIDALLSWFLRPDSPLRRFFIFLTEPVVALFRPLSMRLTRNSRIPISFAHLFAYFFIILIQWGVNALMVWMYY